MFALLLTLGTTIAAASSLGGRLAVSPTVIGRGQYGAVHKATLDGRAVVAKRAAAAVDGADADELARRYFEVEAEVNVALARATPVGFCRFLGCGTADGEH